MLEVDQLTKVYPFAPARARPRPALREVSFTVAPGEAVGLLGPNGAGKTTTLRVLAGALAPTSGQVRIAGHDLASEPVQARARLGFVAEVPAVYPEMRVASFLRFCARLRHVPATEENRAVRRVLTQTGLEEVADHLVGALSKGYRQRVGVAQALVHAPAVLLLDEPAAGLDPAQRRDLRALVRQLAGDSVTVLLSTHDLAEVEAICDRVLILHEGALVQAPPAPALVLDLRVRLPSDDLQRALEALPDVRRVLATEGGAYRLWASADVREAAATVAVGAGLLELRQAASALEDRYLSATGGAS